ncbi:uncharacterized protein LOC123552127 [Mercenaria mercenaria]|uniref:uncharacterized protein LOC123552127 n=1 Tax=Mercenaria mercenaria TaxID=6596 RepID=UPI00234ED408|nr:uncharacterized protein LOC123552127 [Mercenaria mercenaria]
MRRNMSSLVARPWGGRHGIKPVKQDDSQRKLPRPIVFWSLNEKTAYRRNRVVQTRMNMIMDDIATQRESSRKIIRYEAHKFRQKNSRYYQHPLGLSDDAQKLAVNIAPPNWKPPHENLPTDRGSDGNDSGSESENEDCDTNEMSPRKRGIITRSKKPTVSFSVNKEVHQIESDLEIDDIENQTENTNEHESITFLNNSKVRVFSAPQSRDVPELPGQFAKRQQSAFPVLRSSTDCDNDNSVDIDKVRNMSEQFEYEKNRRMNKLTHDTRSDNYFDKSKAAYQLRQDLRKKAKMRKEGIKTTVFTLQDAINLEKENFLKSNGRVMDYIKRIEKLKRAESSLVNKWTKDAIVQQLNI